MINSHFCGVLWCFMGNDELCFSTSRFYMFLSSAESRGAVLLSCTQRDSGRMNSLLSMKPLPSVSSGAAGFGDALLVMEKKYHDIPFMI